jgi:hypothetical protein
MQVIYSDIQMTLIANQQIILLLQILILLLILLIILTLYHQSHIIFMI